MKLANILAQYLYTHKRLDLPGIGTFFLDTSVVAQPENSKHRSSVAEGVRFEPNVSVSDPAELVNYISSKTGKMKPLAASDLESYLELAKQFLNIGKPFTFEGIGNLMKIKPGEYEFSSEAIMTEKRKDIPEKEPSATAGEEKYESFLSNPSKKSFRKPVLTLLILLGIGLAIWGGYIISSNNSDNDNSSEEATTNNALPVDSSQLKPKDTVVPKPVITDYKYVLEIAKAKRAFRRYNQLRDIDWKVEMETKDSIDFKLYMLLPVRPDTTKVLDSLTVLTGKRVWLEHQN